MSRSRRPATPGFCVVGNGRRPGAPLGRFATARPSRARSNGFTLIEMLIVIVMIGVILSIALRPLNRSRQKINARSARVEASMGLALARSAAISRGCISVFHLQVNGNVTHPNSKMWVTTCKAETIGAVGTAVDTLGRVDTLSKRFGVTVSGTADSIRYDARGFTVGYASGAYAFSAAAGARDSLTINAMGRVAQ